MWRRRTFLTTAFSRSWLASARVKSAIDLRRAALLLSCRYYGPVNVRDACKVPERISEPSAARIESFEVRGGGWGSTVSLLARNHSLR